LRAAAGCGLWLAVVAVSVVAEWAGKGTTRQATQRWARGTSAFARRVDRVHGLAGGVCCDGKKKKLQQSLWWPVFLLCLIRLPVSGLCGDAGLGRRLNVEPELLVACRFFFRSGGFNLFLFSVNKGEWV